MICQLSNTLNLSQISSESIPGAGYNSTDNSVTFPGPIIGTPSDGNNYIEVANTTNKTSPTEGMCWFNKTTVKWMCRDSSQNVEIGPAAASINDNSIAPVKLQYSSGTADNTTFYRGDGVWGTPVTGSPGDNTVTPAKLYATTGTAGAGYYYQGNGTWGTPSGSGDMSESVWASGGYITVAKGGTGAGTAADARSSLGLGTIATQASDNVSITGGTINIAGVLTAKLNVVAKSGSPTLTGSELYGTVIESTATQTLTLPAKTQGMQVCVTATSAHVVKISPNGSDYFVYEGTAWTTNKIATSSGADGDYICFYGSSVSNKWYVTGRGKNAWTASAS